MSEAVRATSKLIKGALRTGAIILLVALIGSIAYGSPRISISLAAGYVTAAASFVVLSLVVVRAFGGTTRAPWIAVLGLIKMGIIGAALWWLVSRALVDPFAFLGGFSTMVAALLIEALKNKG